MNNKFSQKVEKTLMPLMTKLGNNIYLKSITEASLGAFSLFITGSIFMIIASFPIPAVEAWVAEIGLADYLWKGVDSTYSIIGLVMAYGIAYSLAGKKDTDKTQNGVLSLAAYIILTPFIVAEEGGAGLPLTYTGSRGLFLAIILGFTIPNIYKWFQTKNITIKLPDTVPPAVSKSFSSIIPGAFILSLALAIKALADSFDIHAVHDIIANLIQVPLSYVTGNIFGILIFIFLNSFLWLFGIHGAFTVGTITGPILTVYQDQNRLAFQAGEELPHIITPQFLESYVYIGGAGATLGLALLIFLMARRKKSSQITKSLGPMVLTPSLFNINEPVIFGVPIVMNFILAIPFILAPIMNAIVAYLATSMNLVARTTGTTVLWTTPPVISGILATNDWRAGVLQIVLIIMDIMIYLPFFMMIEKRNKLLESENAKQGENNDK